MASGYEKDACGVNPDGPWSPPARRPWLQRGIDLAILFCAIGLYLAVMISVLASILG